MQRNLQWDSWQSSQQEQIFWQEFNRLKDHLLIKKLEYCKENNLCFNCSYSNYSKEDCKYLFNSNQVLLKDDKIKSQSFRAHSCKHARTQALYASNSSNDNSSNHNIHIIKESDSESERSHK